MSIAVHLNRVVITAIAWRDTQSDLQTAVFCLFFTLWTCFAMCLQANIHWGPKESRSQPEISFGVTSMICNYFALLTSCCLTPSPGEWCHCVRHTLTHQFGRFDYIGQNQIYCFSFFSWFWIIFICWVQNDIGFGQSGQLSDLRYIFIFLFTCTVIHIL